MKMQREQHLDEIADWYLDDDGLLDGWRSLQARLVRYRFLSMEDCVAGRELLELGMADGQMTRYFLEACRRVVCVEGAEGFVEQGRRLFAEELRRGKLEVVHSLFEDYRPDRTFEVVIAGHILEHLPEPVEMLRRFGRWVTPGGFLLVAVPNAHSLHRLAAVKMGLLGTADELNEQDVRLGHLRCYTPGLLQEHLAAADLELVDLRGILLKPLANRQIEGVWTPQMLDGFYELGQDLPELCAEILAVCTAGSR
jgi:SAM-dependent methyltransferase